MSIVTSEAYAMHERSAYANATGCADHDTDSECAAYRSGYSDGFGKHDHDSINCGECSSVFDTGFQEGEGYGHCCNHS